MDVLRGTYVDGDPVNFIDPSGREKQDGAGPMARYCVDGQCYPSAFLARWYLEGWYGVPVESFTGGVNWNIYTGVMRFDRYADLAIATSKAGQTQALRDPAFERFMKGQAQTLSLGLDDNGFTGGVPSADGSPLPPQAVDKLWSIIEQAGLAETILGKPLKRFSKAVSNSGPELIGAICAYEFCTSGTRPGDVLDAFARCGEIFMRGREFQEIMVLGYGSKGWLSTAAPFEICGRRCFQLTRDKECLGVGCDSL